MILGIDLGTGSVKTLVVDDEGSTVAATERAYAVHAPQTGWSETDPEAWWQALVGAVRSLPEHVRRQVTAIGLSGQMHSLVLCTDEGTPVRAAILWSDARSEAVLPAFRSLSLSQRRRLGNPIVAGMTGPSLLWVARNEPAAVSSARWALQPKDWLRLRMTGVAATDPSDASATLLYDIEADAWARDVLETLGLPAGLLPPIAPSDARGGGLTEGPAHDLGLQPGTPVAVGAGDTAAAALGAGLVREGEAQLSVGTGAQIVVIGSAEGASAGPSTEPAVHRFRSALPGQSYTMAAMQNAGLALNWVRSLLGITWEELYASFDAERIRPALVFLPYLSGERTPLMDSTARAAWLGLGLHHTRDDLVRAALAGVALSILDGFLAVREAGVNVEALRVTGGGLRDARFAQFLCDLLGVPFQPTETPRASAAGAVELARRMLGRDGQGIRSGHEASPPRMEPRPLTDDVRSLVTTFHRVRDRLLQEGA
ncbi:MAG: FGGY family carbohydrate kinase [Deinococcales bacterium]